VHVARGSCSNMGQLFKVLLARGSDPYLCSLFSKSTSRVVVVDHKPRFSKCYSRVVVIRTYGRFFFKVQLVRGSCRSMGSLFKVLPARGSDSYLWSLFFSNFNSCVVVVGAWGRFSKYYTRVVVIRTCGRFFQSPPRAW
jgi:hypothetical protein